jgi:lipoyl(octanoyl) transferase
VETLVRVLPYTVADGATNMAMDESLVRGAAEGLASLRFYGWSEATVSLGYFQPAAVRLSNSRLADLPFVRRPSGGATLVHHHELTYALALPPGASWQAGESWMPRMHRIISTALGELGIGKTVESVQGVPIKHGEVLCFQQHTAGDLLSGGRKVVGSAQRKYRQALMQHGSILLAQSEHTPELPGLRELAGLTWTPKQVMEAITITLGKETGWTTEEADLSEPDRALVRELAERKYRSAEWNERR